MNVATLSQLISPKVLAATGGAGLGSVLSPAVIWLVGVLAFGVPGDAAHQAEAMAAVPSVINSLIVALLATVGGFIPGYLVTDPSRTFDEVPPEPPASDPELEVATESNEDDDELDEEPVVDENGQPLNVNSI